MRGLCLLFLLCNSVVIFGQDTFDSISTKSLISNFRAKVDKSKLFYDSVYGWEMEELAIFQQSPLYSCPLMVERLNRYRAEWKIESTSNGKSNLYLTKIVSVPDNNKRKNQEIENVLAQTYGRNSHGIPASWYSGTLIVYFCPKQLFNEIVSKEKEILTISNGEVASRVQVKARNGDMEKMRRGVTGIYKPIGSIDGCWHSRLQYRLDLLDDFVNSGLPKNSILVENKKYSLLVVTDTLGYARCHLLEPKNIENKDERALVESLSERINQLPRWSFGWLETVEGKIFPARYLIATYSYNDGWSFKDYLDNSV